NDIQWLTAGRSRRHGWIGTEQRAAGYIAIRPFYRIDGIEKFSPALVIAKFQPVIAPAILIIGVPGPAIADVSLETECSAPHLGIANPSGIAEIIALPADRHALQVQIRHLIADLLRQKCIINV